LLTKTPIRDAGATAEAKSAATRQSMGSSLRAFRIVPESALKTVSTRPAATASLIPHPTT
jgi:hypothetical protein